MARVVMGLTPQSIPARPAQMAFQVEQVVMAVPAAAEQAFTRSAQSLSRILAFRATPFWRVALATWAARAAGADMAAASAMVALLVRAALAVTVASAVQAALAVAALVYWSLIVVFGR